MNYRISREQCQALVEFVKHLTPDGKLSSAAIAKEEPEDGLSGFPDHTSPDNSRHRLCINLAIEEALDNACAKYGRYAKEHYHYKKSRGRPYQAVEHINPCHTSWRELGLDNLAEVLAERFALLGYDTELSFFEASISLCRNELQLEFRLLGEEFEFSLVRIRPLYFADDIRDNTGDKPENGGDYGC